jgi:hypothetical protein
MNTAATTLESIVSKRQQQPVENEDDAFCNLLKQQLKLIPDCDSKDDLKISLQQMVLACKRQVKNTGNVAHQNPFSLLLNTPTEPQQPYFGSPRSNSSSIGSTGY